MAARRGLSVSQFLLVFSLVLDCCLCVKDEEYRICSIPCCTVEPSCSQALTVTCDCPGRDTIAMKADDVPVSVKAVHMLNAKSVIIHKDTISSLPSLTNFTLRGMDTVVIERGGMTLQKQSTLRQIRIEDTGTLRIKSQAFAGVWEQRASIGMRRIAQLHIESNAFHHASRLGPSLMLQDIEMLALAPRAFKSPIARMSLNNVKMEVCHGRSFGHNVRATQFNNVTIGEAKAECVSGFDSSATLSVQASRIDVLHPQAFSGTLRQLIINNSDFLTMHEKSIHLRLRDMKMSGLFIKNISSHGLSVKADDAIRLEKIRVNSLRKRALAGLQILPTPTGFYPPVVIQRLEVIEAEGGSLAFSECVDVQMTDLDLVAPWPPICPTEKWTRTLSDASASGPLSPAQHELFWQLYERGVCDEDDRETFPVVANLPHCARHHSGDAVAYNDRGDAALMKKTDASSRETNDKLPSRRVVGDATHASPENRGSSVIKKVGSPLTSFEVKIPEDGEDHEGPGGDAAAFEYLVDNKEADDDIQNRDTRKSDTVTNLSESPSAQALRAPSVHGITAKPPSHVKRETPPANLHGTAEASREIPPTSLHNATGLHAVGTVADPDPAADQSTAASSSSAVIHADQQHRLLLYLALGAVLSLATVLAAALLVLLIRRRHRRQADDPAPPVETLLMVLANRILRQSDCGGQNDAQVGGGGGGVSAGGQQRHRTVSGSSGFSSARQSVDSHEYEPIREDLLLPLPAGPAPQLIWLDENPAGSDQVYDNLLDR